MAIGLRNATANWVNWLYLERAPDRNTSYDDGYIQIGYCTMPVGCVHFRHRNSKNHSNHICIDPFVLFSFP